VFFQDHVNIDVTTSIISASTSAYVPYLPTYGIKMDTLFIYVKAFLNNIETDIGYILRLP